VGVRVRPFNKREL